MAVSPEPEKKQDEERDLDTVKIKGKTGRLKLTLRSIKIRYDVQMMDEEGEEK